MLFPYGSATEQFRTRLYCSLSVITGYAAFSLFAFDVALVPRKLRLDPPNMTSANAKISPLTIGVTVFVRRRRASIRQTPKKNVTAIVLFIFFLSCFLPRPIGNTEAVYDAANYRLAKRLRLGIMLIVYLYCNERDNIFNVSFFLYLEP